MAVQLVEITRQHFHQALVSARSQLRLTVPELCVIFEIHPLTMERWLKGEAAPHPVGREPILQALRRRGAEIEIPDA